MIFNLGGQETFIILLAFVFLFVGVPLLSILAGKLGSRTKLRIKRWFSSFWRPRA